MNTRTIALIIIPIALIGLVVGGLLLFGVIGGDSDQEYILELEKPEGDTQVSASGSLEVFGNSSLSLGLIQIRVVDSEGNQISGTRVGIAADPDAAPEEVGAWASFLNFSDEVQAGEYTLEVFPQSEGEDSEKKVERQIEIVAE